MRDDAGWVQVGQREAEAQAALRAVAGRSRGEKVGRKVFPAGLSPPSQEFLGGQSFRVFGFQRVEWTSTLRSRSRKVQKLMVALTLREVGARMRGDVRVLLEDQWEALQERGGPDRETILAMQKEVETFPDAGDFAVKLDRYNFRAFADGRSNADYQSHQGIFSEQLFLVKL